MEQNTNGFSSSIAQALHDKAIKEGPVQTTAELMKKNIASSRRRKCVGASCIDPKAKKNGKVISYSALQIAVFQLFQKMKSQRFENRNVVSSTDLILKIILDWNTIAEKFKRRNLIAHEELYGTTSKVNGKVRLTVPWITLALKEFYPDHFVTKEGSGEITIAEVRKRTSSTSSYIVRILDLLGLLMKWRDRVGKNGCTQAFYLKENLHALSFQQLHFLYLEGQKILRDQKTGKFDQLDQLGIISDEFSKEIKTRIVEIKPGTGKIISQVAEVLDDGTVRVETCYK